MNKYPIILLTLLLLLAGCQKDTGKHEGNGQESEVEMRLTAPVTYGTRAADPEEKIEYLDLLVFEGDEYKYRRHAYLRSGDTYRSTLKIGDNQTIYFFVNCRDFLDSCTELQEGKSWLTDIRPALVAIHPESVIDIDDGLPMWGVKTTDIKNITLNDIGKVSLLRSVAGVEVYMLDDTNFEFTECYIYFAPDRGYLSSTAANLTAFDNDMLTAEVPAGMQTNKILAASAVVNNVLSNTLYLFDNDATTVSASKRNSRIVIGGEYQNSGVTTYYPLDFVDDTSAITQVVRNHKYQFMITKVNGEGVPDPGEAAENASANLEVKIIPWKDMDDSDIFIDASRYISIERKYCIVEKYINSFADLHINSNIPAADFILDFADGTNGTQTEVAGGIKNNSYEVTLISDSDGTPKTLRVKALKQYSSSDADQQLESLVIKTGRIQFTVEISRTDINLNEWWNGGNGDYEIGKDN